ncbi:MAG: IS21 family transposase [Sulfurimonas sp.]|nr:IS21 family transposase [Sulfurimonas sp.]
MSEIKKVLRLRYHNNMSVRQIQSMSGISKSSVANYIKIYTDLAVPLEEVLALSDADLEDLFFIKKSKTSQTSIVSLSHPDWGLVREELSRKGMTRLLLWEEYKAKQPTLYSYSQFNRYFNKFLCTINPSMRQLHYAGDKLFIDYSGMTMPIVDQITGEISKAQIFVSVLGASGYTFVDASATQSTKEFIASHVKAFIFYGGVPNILVPDNLKAAVISHKKGGVVLNSSYADMGAHYGVAIEPARPYKPQDKSKVELGVKAIQRWILMRLRHHTFFSVDELNQKINELLDGYNNKVIKRLGKSRTELFYELDEPMLHPLRANHYIFKEFKTATVGVDYHIELEGSGYSVPFKYLGKKVDVVYTSTSVTISHEGSIIANHPRLSQRYHDSTLIEHMPSEHQYQYEKWNPRRILNWANTIGVHATTLMEAIMQSKSHQVRAYKSCMALLSLSKTYGHEALEMVCTVALELKTYKVASIESMLKTKTYLEYYNRQKIVANNNSYHNNHANIRGSAYYSMENEIAANNIQGAR